MHDTEQERRELEDTLRSLFRGPDDAADDQAREFFRQFAARLTPRFRELARLLVPDPPVTAPPPRTARAARRRKRAAIRQLEALEDAVRRGELVERDDVVRSIATGIIRFRTRVAAAIRDARDRRERDEDADAIETRFRDVVDDAIEQLAGIFQRGTR